MSDSNTYSYEGRNRQGHLIEGYMEARCEKSVVQYLSRLEITPVTIKRVSNNWSSKDVKTLFAKPNLKELALFAKQMNSLLKGGVPVNTALKVVIETIKTDALIQGLTQVVLDLESGNSLARCFQKQNHIFPDFFTSMVEVGEHTGMLDEVFLQIHDYLQMEIKTKQRIQTALRYPMIVVLTIFFAVIMINFFVIPSFKDFFMSMDAELPFATQWLIAFSNACLEYWWVGLTLVVGGIGGWRYWLSQETGRLFWDRFKLSWPLIGSIIHRSTLSRFTRSLSIALHAGLPLLDAIEVVAHAADNRYITNKILTMRKGLERGEPLSVCAMHTNIFTPLVIQMISVSEHTGNLNDNLIEISYHFESDVDYDLKRLSDLLEPLLIGVIAAMVLILALGVFLPLWDLSAVAMNQVG